MFLEVGSQNPFGLSNVLLTFLLFSMKVSTVGFLKEIPLLSKPAVTQVSSRISILLRVHVLQAIEESSLSC